MPLRILLLLIVCAAAVYLARGQLMSSRTESFSQGGLEFQYPGSYSVSTDESDPGLTTWTFAGTSSTLVASRFNLQAKPEDVVQQMAASLKSSFTSDQVTASNESVNLGGKDIAGQSLSGIFHSGMMRQTVIAFSHNQATYSIVLQDLGDSASAEAQRARALLAASFKWAPSTASEPKTVSPEVAR